MLVVFGITLLAFLLFASEVVPVDVTALITMALLMILEPWTRISIEEGISGFSNEATITVLAMFILSAGISRTGAVQMLSTWMSSFAGTDERKQLLAVVGVGGLPSAVLNNTPIVAMLIPAVSDLARGGGTSPSKLLIPLSYSAMVGGMLTLIGTSTNIVASDVSERLIGNSFSMFEFTPLGAIVFVTGTLYVVFVAQHLLPERVSPDEGLLEEYEMEGYLTEVVVDDGSPLVGESVDAILAETDLDVEVIQLIRDGERYIEPFTETTIRAGDVFIVRANLATVRALMRAEGLSFASSPDVTEEELEAVARRKTLVELVVPAQSRLVGTSLSEALFRERYDANVLAIRRERTLLHNRLDELLLRGGDTLLVQATEESLNQLATDPDVIVAHQVADPDYRTGKIPIAVAIIGGVVGLAALGVVDILIAALGGVILMLFSGVLHSDELYDAIEWNVIFLLAGLIPLGIAFEETGAAALIGSLVAQSATVLPPIGVLWLFYVVTALTTALVSNAGSVVLLIPVGVATANQIGADPFAFVLAVTFAASADFMTPIGYQTNLLVYGPGGYRFTDYFRVGAPLQVLLSIATVLGIALIWGIT
nr:SLC13 family permease [Halomarina sp. BND7]